MGWITSVLQPEYLTPDVESNALIAFSAVRMSIAGVFTK
jgi:hypothetical protein